MRRSARRWAAGLCCLLLMSSVIQAEIRPSKSLLLLDLNLSVLSSEQKAYLESREPLRYCVDPDWLPFEAIDQDGKYVGVGADLLMLMKKRGQLSLTFVPSQRWSETLELAREKRCDFLPLVMKTPARSEYLNFTEPYLETPSVIAARPDAGHLSSLAEIGHHPLAIMRDFSFVEIYRQRYPDINLIEVDSYAEGLERVASGELFGMLGNMASISHVIKSMGNENVVIGGRIAGDSQLSVAVRNDDPQLLEIFQTLADSISSAEKQVILNAWSGYQYGSESEVDLMPAALGLVLMGLVLLAYWGYRLRLLNAGLVQANLKLTELNRHDTLTGLCNRAFFDDCLDQALARCKRRGAVLSVAMIDLDHFKRLNDEYGHAFGDYCLREVSGLMEGMLQRGTETVARYGGEEFVVMSEGEAPHIFAEHLESFRQRVAAMELEFAGATASLSVSIGLHSRVPNRDDSSMAYLLAADQALYKAKSQGRNCLVDCSPSPLRIIRDAEA